VPTDTPGPGHFQPLMDQLTGSGSGIEIWTLTTGGITGDMGHSDPVFVYMYNGGLSVSMLLLTGYTQYSFKGRHFPHMTEKCFWHVSYDYPYLRIYVFWMVQLFLLWAAPALILCSHSHEYHALLQQHKPSFAVSIRERPIRSFRYIKKKKI